MSRTLFFLLLCTNIFRTLHATKEDSSGKVYLDNTNEGYFLEALDEHAPTTYERANENAYERVPEIFMGSNSAPIPSTESVQPSTKSILSKTVGSSVRLRERTDFAANVMALLSIFLGPCHAELVSRMQGLQIHKPKTRLQVTFNKNMFYIWSALSILCFIYAYGLPFVRS